MTVISHVSPRVRRGPNRNLYIGGLLSIYMPKNINPQIKNCTLNSEMFSFENPTQTYFFNNLCFDTFNLKSISHPPHINVNHNQNEESYGFVWICINPQTQQFSHTSINLNHLTENPFNLQEISFSTNAPTFYP